MEFDYTQRIDETMIGRKISDVVDDFLTLNINYCKTWLVNHMSIGDIRHWLISIDKNHSMYTSGMDISFDDVASPSTDLLADLGKDNDGQVKPEQSSNSEEEGEILLKESYAEITKRGRNSVTSELFQDIVGKNSKQTRFSITMSRGE